MTRYSFPERLADELACRNMLNAMIAPLRESVRRYERENPLPAGWQYELSVKDEIGPKSIILTATLTPARIAPKESDCRMIKIDISGQFHGKTIASVRLIDQRGNSAQVSIRFTDGSLITVCGQIEFQLCVPPIEVPIEP